MPVMTFLFSLAFDQAHYYNILPLAKRSVCSQWGVTNPSTGPGHERLIKRADQACNYSILLSSSVSRAAARSGESVFPVSILIRIIGLCVRATLYHIHL